MAATVDQDDSVQAIHAELVKLSATQERLLARHQAPSAILARRFDSRIPVAPEVADVSVSDAGREMNELARQLAALERRMDAEARGARDRGLRGASEDRRVGDGRVPRNC